MRWLLADPQNPEEQRWKQHVAAASDRWWRAFQANAKSIAGCFTGAVQFDIVQFMDDHLPAIDPRLCWEYGPARRSHNVQAGGHRLVITPQAEHGLRPMLNFVLGRAPQIPGWEFYAYRLPESVENAKAAVQGRVGVEFQQAGIEARIGRRRKIDLLYTFPYEKWTLDQARNVAFVLTETLLGEETLDGWIGTIDVADGREQGHRWLPLDRAGATVSAVAQSMLEQLPAEPVWKDNKDGKGWSNYQLEPERGQDDYPLRSDVIVGSTCLVELIEAAIGGKLFDSRCHSRCHENFCYLKIDAAEVDTEHRLDHRANLEDPLDAALTQAGVGGTIGGASGIRYSYVDLSLSNVMQAIPIICQVLARQRAPLRTWLLFFDSQFENEWQGVYAQTPPPPRYPIEE